MGLLLGKTDLSLGTVLVCDNLTLAQLREEILALPCEFEFMSPRGLVCWYFLTVFAILILLGIGFDDTGHYR